MKSAVSCWQNVGSNREKLDNMTPLLRPLSIVLFLLSIVLLPYCAHSQCIHDQLLKEKPPQRQVTQVRYEPRILVRDGKRIVQADSYSGLRIHMYTTELEKDLASDPTKLTFLKDTVFPKAVARYKELLTVVPVKGNLKLDRQCGSFFVNTKNETRECSSYSDVTCGDFGPIPADHYSSQPIYSAPGTVSGYTTGGDGVANTDIIIYVRAKDTDTCQSSQSTLAYASFCVQDTQDRPVAGYVNYCRNNTDVSDTNKAVITTLHEIGHALAYSSSLYPYFRKEDGTAYTKRTLDGSPPYVYDHGTPPLTPSTDTMQTFTERGHDVKKLVLPIAREAAREHFGCSTLNGVELEDQGGSGTATSHPEMRVYLNDYMNGQYPSFPVISKTTMAVFESSGWYKPDYTKVDFHSWGYKKGCNFAMDKCISDGSPTDAKHFCTEAEKIGCTQDLKGFGQCSLVAFKSEIDESYYRYFTATNQGGSTALIDYCPTFENFNWRPGGAYPSGRSLCTNSDGVPSADNNSRGENYGANSKCAINTLLSKKFVEQRQPSYGGCFQFDCRTDRVRILIGDTFVSCGVNDAGKAVSVEGYYGNLYCPEYSVACPSAQDCSVDCGDHGVCVSNICVCVSGWDGDRCQYQRNSASVLGLSVIVFVMSLMIHLFVW